MATTHVDLFRVLARPKETVAERLETALSFGAAASVVLSIALSQILLGGAILARIVSRRPLAWPPRFVVPVAGFWLLTVASIATSNDPKDSVLVLKKLFVFAIIPLAYCCFDADRVRGLTLGWAAGAALSAVVALLQFAARWREAITLKAPLYDYILDGRIHGVQGHWMTFGGVQMIALLCLVAFLLFSDPGRWKIAGWVCAGLIWIVLILGLSRSVFLAGVPTGFAVLLWRSPRWRIATAFGVALLVIITLSLTAIRERALSVVQPHGDVDSNSRRVLMARTGLRMIAAHPWLGVGPGQVGPQFSDYLPEDAPQPLPTGWYGHLHNVYLQYAAERGVPALLCLLWMFACVVKDTRRRIAMHSPNVWVQHAVLAVVAAILAEGLFEHNLGDSEVLTMFLVVITGGYSAQRGTEAEGVTT